MKHDTNYGLAILKSILAFYIVKTHCFDKHLAKNKFYIYILGKDRCLHVPSFFNMSFYFNYRILISKDSKNICKRFERLLIPYIFWPVIVYTFNNIFSKLCKSRSVIPFKKVIIQLILGYGIINTFWFQLCLMITTYVFVFIIYIFKESYLLILQMLMISSYILQYSKFNDYIFVNLPSNYKMSIGREIMMIPFSVVGFNFAKYKIMFSALIFFIIDYFHVFSHLGDYNGIKLNVLSVCLILIFASFPLEKIKNKYIKYCIIYIIRYTGGIYYLHTTVFSYLRLYIISMRKKTIEGVIINYIITYLICHLGMLIFGNTKAKNLFS